MKLKRSKDNPCAWVNEKGEVIFFDPSVSKDGPSFALIKKKMLLDWLDENSMQLLWLIGGEKQLFKGYGAFFGYLTYIVLCHYEGHYIVSETWFNRLEGHE